MCDAELDWIWEEDPVMVLEELGLDAEELDPSCALELPEWSSPGLCLSRQRPSTHSRPFTQSLWVLHPSLPGMGPHAASARTSRGMIMNRIIVIPRWCKLADQPDCLPCGCREPSAARKPAGTSAGGGHWCACAPQARCHDAFQPGRHHALQKARLALDIGSRLLTKRVLTRLESP